MNPNPNMKPNLNSKPNPNPNPTDLVKCSDDGVTSLAQCASDTQLLPDDWA